MNGLALHPPLNGLALCAGAGGLELGLHLALGDAYRTVVGVEWEASAASVLVARQQDGGLPPFPIWDSVATFDGRPWRGVVDIVSGGFPCQPFSVAGKRGGDLDPRHLWPHIARIIGECQPRYVFLENVPGLLTTPHVPHAPFAPSGGNWPTPDTQNARSGHMRAEAKGKHAMSLHHVVEEWKGPHDGGPESEGPG